MNVRSSYYTKLLSLSSLIFVIFVILWGAFVRASGSGAGCGAHWPLCDGQIIVRDVNSEKFIELFHRITSGLSFLLVLFTFLHVRSKENDEILKKSAAYSFVLICSEALIGAGLVLFGWVKDDSSVSRAFVVAGHLVNSLALLFSLSVLTYVSFSRNRLQNPSLYSWRSFMLVCKEHLFLIFLFFIVSSFGAVTALGDTIFPSKSLIEGIQEDFSLSAHFLIKLRVIHPLLALYLSAKIISFFLIETNNKDTILTDYLSKIGITTLILQIMVGAANVILLAPTYLQILHLALAVVLWITLSATLCARTFDQNK